MSSSNQPVFQPHHIAGVAAGLGAFLSLNSTYAILNPKGVLSQLGFSTAVSPSDQKVTEGLIRMYGGARAAMGLSQLLLWYVGDHTAVAYNLFLGSIVAGVDGWVSKDVLGKRHWEHWGAIPLSLGLGAWLLSQLE